MSSSVVPVRGPYRSAPPAKLGCLLPSCGWGGTGVHQEHGSPHRGGPRRPRRRTRRDRIVRVPRRLSMAPAAGVLGHRASCGHDRTLPGTRSYSAARIRPYLPAGARPYARARPAWSRSAARASRKRQGQAGRTRSRCPFAAKTVNQSQAAASSVIARPENPLKRRVRLRAAPDTRRCPTSPRSTRRPPRATFSSHRAIPATSR